MKKALIIVPIALAIIGTGVFMAMRLERQEREAARRLALQRQAKRNALMTEAKTLAAGLPGYGKPLSRCAEDVERALTQSRLSSAFLASNRELAGKLPPPPPTGPHQELTPEIVAGALAGIGKQGYQLQRLVPMVAARGQALLEKLGPRTSVQDLGEVVDELRLLDRRLADGVRDMAVGIRLVDGLAAELEEFTMAKARERNGEMIRLQQERGAVAYKKLAAEELVAFEKWRPNQRQRLLAHNYSGIVAVAVKKGAACKTEEGRAVYALAERRYRKLEWLKTYMIDRINGDALLWGWGQGRAKQDILSADQVNLRTTTREIPWSAVSMDQFLRLVRRYLNEMPVPPTTDINLNLALAVLCYEHGREDEAKKIVATVSFGGVMAREAAVELFPEW